VKQKLRGLIPIAREKEAADLVPFVNDDPAPEAGQWTAKDQLAHLTVWRQVAASELRAAHRGEPEPVISDDDDHENGKIYDRTHDLPAASIISDAVRAWDELASALEESTEDELASPRQRHPREQYWHVIVNQTCRHIAAHLAYWHHERGDEKAEEAVTRWARDLAVATFPGEPQAGVGEYNLGCFYALRGRAAEAIPYLRRGIELRPDLREWAKEDTDLDPIRSTTELAELLG
jgi:hypothetical protein